MTRDELTMAVARAIMDALPITPHEQVARHAATAALSAIEEAHVIVPREKLHKPEWADWFRE